MLTRKGYIVFGIPTALVLFLGWIATVIPDQGTQLKPFYLYDFILNSGHALVMLAFLAFWVLCYFLPSINASHRKHQNKAAIIGLNILLGWTVLGWIVAFIWSLTATVESTSQSALFPSATDAKQPV